MDLKSAFDSAASDYDTARRQLIPCFDLFYGTAVELLPPETRSVLDLGAGTGLLSRMILERLPHSRITLIDLSEDMLARAPHSDRCNVAVADYRAALPAGPFDAVVSALSIHHLEDAEKQQLFQRIFDELNPGGIFVNADQVLGETPAIERRYRQTWLREVRAAGIEDAALSAALERMKMDRMATLDSQLLWLREAGFIDVHCSFQHDNFAVYSCHRAPACGIL